MKKILMLVALLAAAGAAVAQNAPDEKFGSRGPKLDRVFLIVLENHGYGQVINNPNMPFINQFAQAGNTATNYFAVAHPSLTNYLEIVGASNFGVHSDNGPDWHNAICSPNLATATTNTDNPTSPNICPIGGTGTDAATPAIDFTNEVQGDPGLLNIDGVMSIPAATNIVGETIADQLVAAGKTWKSYQDSLPIAGADNVTASDGNFTDLTDFSKINPQLNPPLSQGDLVKLYAAKHNPFVYFRNVQEGTNPMNSLANVVGFDGAKGIWADLASGRVPNFSFIVPNQCNDQHGRGNAGAFCNFDPGTDGTQATLNPALAILADQATEKLVTAIKASPAWHRGHNAIVLVYDENDYSFAPNTNRVVLTVLTNHNSHHHASPHRGNGDFYTHFSLVKTLDAAFGLPCLNHACDSGVKSMSVLFDED